MLLATTLLLPLAIAPSEGGDQLAAVQALFDESCTICHDSSADLNLEDPSALVSLKSEASGKPLVVPGDANASYLYLKMIGAEGIEGESMPMGDDILPDEELAKVSGWINAMAAPEPAATEEAAPAAPAVPATGDPDKLAAATAIFEESCTICHDSSADLNLEDAGALISLASTQGTPLVDPGNPNGSYLYMKMAAAEGIEGESMPLGDDPLPAEQLAAVQEWIASIPVPGAAGEAAGEGEASGEGEGSGEGEVKPPSVDDPVRPKRKAKPGFYGTHHINLPTTTTLGKKSVSFRIHHRLGRVGGVGDRSYIGFAGPAVMSIGAEYGIVDGLDVLARWTNSRLAWELGLKYVPVRQEDGKPLSFGMFASFDAITDFNTTSANRFTGNFQVMLSRQWFERWTTQLNINYSMLTNHSPNVLHDFGDGAGTVQVTDNRGTLNVGLATTVWLGKKRRNGLDLEYQLPIPSDVFYYNGGNVNPDATNIGSWALGWSARRGLHVFQILVSNTQNIHTNLIAPGGDTVNPFAPFGDFFFGFNITRKWKL